MEIGSQSDKFRLNCKPTYDEDEEDIIFPAEEEKLVNRKRQFSRLPSQCEIKLNLIQKPSDVEDGLFDLLCDQNGKLSIVKFWSVLSFTGLRETDPRLKECRSHFLRIQREKQQEAEESGDIFVDREEFRECVQDNIVIIGKAFLNQFVIPDFGAFTKHIDAIYESCKLNTSGQVADVIPQLARQDPNCWGVALCTIDGQRHSLGHCTVPFCVRSIIKPLKYAMVLSDLGEDVVHKYVGQEPSGRSFKELALDFRNKPHNPMVNAGAIVMASLLKPNLMIADRFDYVNTQFKRMAGWEYVGFHNPSYLSERESADRNFALGYYLRENNCFPANTNLQKTLEFYFQLFSCEVTAESGAVIAATLANGGICPTTGERVLSGEAVRNTLSLMYSCGMYDYSGQFAFKCGLPAKSAVSGVILLVVPNVMGICTWSPPLDKTGNSCRGIQFCEELVRNFNFHNYDNLKHTMQKMDPRSRRAETNAHNVVHLLFAAASGDITALRRFVLTGMDMGVSDYDGRTALHLAAVEGHLPLVKFLIEKCHVNVTPLDRWGFTPLDDAKKFNQTGVTQYLEKILADNEDRASGSGSTADPGSRKSSIPTDPPAVQEGSVV